MTPGTSFTMPLVAKDICVQSRRRIFAKSVVLLKDISFSIARREIVGIVGQSGSGKSTLLKVVNGSVTPQAGTVIVNGQNAHETIGATSAVGYVPQDDVLHDSLRVRETLFYSARLQQPKLRSAKLSA